MKKKNKNKSSLCKKNIHFLSYIHSLANNKKKRNKIIKHVSSGQEINSIIELFINFLNNNIQCGKKCIKFLKKYTNYFDKKIKK